MQMILAAGILVLIFVVSEYISKKTHGMMSAFFLICLFVLLGHWTFFDKMFTETDIISASGSVAIATLASGLFLTHIGTMITVRDLIKQWKIVVIGFFAVAVIGLVGLTIGSMLLGADLAYAGTPIVAGGVAANLIMNEAMANIEALKGIDLTTAKVFAVLVLSLQFIIGLPICSIIMRKDAEDCLKSGRINEFRALPTETGEVKEQKTLIQLPEMFRTPYGILCIACFVSALGSFIGTKTGVSYLLWCMLLGVACRTIGLLPPNTLSAAHSDGYIIFVASIFVARGMKDASPELCLQLIVPLVIIFVLGIASIAAAGFVSSKVFKMSFLMCFGLGLTAMFGAPGTIYISEEVAEGVANGNEEDHQALRAYILPKMMIAGFSTLTVGSVILAGIVAPLMSSIF